ncbi:MAG: ATP-binding protein, partial [Thermoleophilaceae bacterium]
NPGDALVDLFKAHTPCLVLIDEWIAYARQLYGVEGLPAGSFDAHFSFAQALTDAARAVPGAMLVVSIPASDIEFGGECGRFSLTRLVNVVGRMEASWKPATADEGFEIVRRRLFEPIPPDLARERDAVAHRFAELYRAQRGEFPAECAEADYERRILASYPIHPELFDRLYGEWSTLERFQRTRGVLRLMASVVYELWRRDDRSLLVMPGTLPIDASPVVAELTNYLDEGWTPVIATDVDGENALPLRIDNENPAFGRYSATRRVARTIFLGSAPVIDATNRGIDDRRVKLGCVQPGEAPATFGDALRRLANQALYLSTDGQRSWYGLQQTVTRLATDRAATYDDHHVDEELRRRLVAISEKGDFVRLHAAPTAPTEVEDEPTARLVLLGPEHPHSTKVDESAARSFAAEILATRSGGPRVHRNMLAFLAADVARVEELRDATRTALAWNSIHRDRESLRLDSVQLAQIETRRREWNDTVDQRIGEAYQWLLVPSATPGSPEIVWETTRAGGSDPLAVRASRRLRSEEALITTYSGARLRMDLDRIPLWRDDRVEVRDLWSFYSQYLYLPRLRDVQVLLAAIADGVALMTWRQDGFAYADAVDEAAGRFAGLRAGEALALSDAVGVVVRSDVAETQLDLERPSTTSTEPATGPAAPSAAATRNDPAATPAPPRELRRFFGSVELDPTRLSRDAAEIGEAVVAHLNGLVGANVQVTLEIQADIPDGAPDAVVRTVTENAATLRFDPAATGFETE